LKVLSRIAYHIEGRMKGKPTRGRRRLQMLHDLMAMPHSSEQLHERKGLRYR